MVISNHISSKSNTQIKRLRGLRHRRLREQTELYCVEGIRLVAEAAHLGSDIEALIVAPDLLTSAFGWEIVRSLQAHHVPVLMVTVGVYETIFDGAHGIGAIIHQKWETLAQFLPCGELCWVALDAVQYPGNLGTILRTSDAVGGAGVILIGNATDPYDPLAVRARMGAILSQRLARATFTEFAAWKERHQVTVIGTSPSASQDYRAAAYHCPLVLLLGSEGAGLPTEHQAACDALVRIPMVGHSDSLNVAVAAGLFLYEIFHQAGQG